MAMASLKVTLILRLLAVGAEDEAGNGLITKYCGITYCVMCVCVCACECVCVYVCVCMCVSVSVCLCV